MVMSPPDDDRSSSDSDPWSEMLRDAHQIAVANPSGDGETYILTFTGGAPLVEGGTLAEFFRRDPMLGTLNNLGDLFAVRADNHRVEMPVVVNAMTESSPDSINTVCQKCLRRRAKLCITMAKYILLSLGSSNRPPISFF